jgi:hypothetical protein
MVLTSFKLLLQGIRDSLRVFSASKTINDSNLVQVKTAQVVLIVGGVYLGSVLIFRALIVHLLDILTQKWEMSLIAFGIKFIAFLFYYVWIFFVYIFSFLISTFWT